MITIGAKLEITRLDVQDIFVPSFDRFDFRRLEEFFNNLTSRPDADLPPITVVPLPDGTYKVYDGRHRYTATCMAKREEIWAIIITNQKAL